jgi:hypothetical protein
MKQILAIIRDILLAPFRALLNPWRAMHGQIGGGLFQMSLAGIAALLICLFLTVISVAFAFTLWNSPQFVFRDYLWQFSSIIPVILVTTVVVYYMVRAWTQETGERFPDIEQAWKEGLQEVRRSGFDLQRTPLFLLLGSESSLKDQYLMTASELRFVVSNFPKGRGLPLRWYASEEAIFVVLSHVGCLAALARTAAKITTDQRVQVPMQGPSERVGVAATCWPTEDESALDDDSGIRRPGAAQAPAAVVAETTRWTPIA